jgi:CheY-like chemotaxis protein
MLRMDPATAPIPIVLCTGAVREVKALEDHLVAMGVTVVLKPFNIDQLVDAIRDRLGADRAVHYVDAEG